MQIRPFSDFVVISPLFRQASSPENFNFEVLREWRVVTLNFLREQINWHNFYSGVKKLGALGRYLIDARSAVEFSIALSD